MSHKVVLHIYDLSQGMARQLSLAFLGKSIDAIYHTGVVVYGKEYSFGAGIEIERTNHVTRYGKPIQVMEMGYTEVPEELFSEYLEDIRSRYTVETYSLLKHNCNNFSDEVLGFLVGARVPERILNLPSEVINTPLGASLVPMLEQMETQLRGRPSSSVQNIIPSQTSNSLDFSTIQLPQNPVQISTPKTSSENISTDKTPIRATPVNFTPTSENVNQEGISLTSTKQGEVFTPGNLKPTNLVTPQPLSQTPQTPQTPQIPQNPQTPQIPQMNLKRGKSVGGEAVGGRGGGEGTSYGKDGEKEAKEKVREEISREFQLIMAAGEMRANEAAALAFKKVMERYGGRRGESARPKA